MLVVLPPDRLRWAGVLEEESYQRVKCDPRHVKSALSRRDSTAYCASSSEYLLSAQREAGDSASGPDGLRVQDLSAFGRDDVMVIVIQVLVQTAYHILNRSDGLFSCLDPGPKSCETQSRHLVPSPSSQKPTVNLASPFQCCTRLASLKDQPLLGYQNGGIDYRSTSPVQISGIFDKKEDKFKLDSPVPRFLSLGFSPTQKPTIPCMNRKPPTALLRCYSNQERITESYIVLCHCWGEIQDLESEKATLEQSSSTFANATCISGQRLNKIKYIAASRRPTVDYKKWRAGVRARASDGETKTKQTGSGSEQGRGKHNGSVQQPRRHSTWPSVAGQKRLAKEEDRSDDDDQKQPAKGNPTSKHSHNEKLLRYACPLFKHNPDEFAKRRACCGPGWPTVQRVKEHIFRSHKAPSHQCLRCFMEFKTLEALEKHSRAVKPCKVREGPPSSPEVNESTMRVLKQRGKTTATEDEKWYSMYKIIFPEDETVPSPYYEPKEKEPSLPSRAVAKEMFRERLNALLPTMGLDREISRALKSPRGMDLVVSVAMAAFDDTFSAMKREPSPPLDETPSSETLEFPELKDLEIPEFPYGEWLSPLMDTPGQTSQTGNGIELESDELLKPALQQGSTAVDMEGYKFGLPEGAGSQTPSTNALAAPVSQVPGQTEFPTNLRVWRIPPPNSLFATGYWTAQHQTQQQQESQPKRRRLLPVPQGGNSLAHESSSAPAGRSSGPTSPLHSLHVDTGFTFNPTKMDETPIVEEGTHSYWFNDHRRDGTRAKNGPRRESLPDSDTQKIRTMQDYDSYDPQMPNTWHGGIGSLSWTDHQNGNS